MKNLIYSLLLSLIGTALGAQSLTPEVVATSGETFSNSTVTIEWTLGEIMTETYPGSLLLTQGFHQPPADVFAPVARCRVNVIAQIDAEGELALDPSALNNGSSDTETAAEDLTLALDFGDSVLDCDAVGQPAQPVNLVVTDENGFFSSCTSQVSVVDVVRPMVSCRDTTIALDPATGEASLLFLGSTVLYSASDNCGNVAVQIDLPSSGTSIDCDDLVAGNSIIIGVTAEDESANVASCTIEVSVSNSDFACNEAPVAICQESVTAQIDADGNLDLDPASLDNGSFDSETPADELIFSLDFGGSILDCAHVGAPAQPVTLVVTDAAGRTGTCVSLVSVADNIPPISECKDVSLELNPETGEAPFDVFATGALIDRTDNCAISNEVAVSGPGDYDCSHLGENSEIIIVKDVNGNETSCTVIVTITDPYGVCQDNTPPVARCQSTVTAQIDSFGMVTLDPASIDNGSTDDTTAPEDLVFSLDLSNAQLNCNLLTDTVSQRVTLVVTDEAGQSSSCVSRVSVQDTIAPILICQDVSIELDPITGVNQLDTLIQAAVVSVSDNCAENPVLRIVPPSTVEVLYFDCDDLGENTVRLAAKDFDFGRFAPNNESFCDITVTVVDPGFACDEAPVARCQESFVVQLDAYGNPVLDPAGLDNGSFDDNTAPEDLVFSIDFGGSVLDCAHVGAPAQPVTLVVTDAAGRTGTCTSLVSVADNIPPVLVCQDVILELDEETGQRPFNFFTDGFVVSFTDNCGLPPPPTTGGFTFTCAQLGDNQLQFVQQDANGNLAACTATVSVTASFSTCAGLSLPVTWLHFGAHAGAKQVDLQWKTSMEPDNAGFHVERSPAGTDWSVIGNIPASLDPQQAYSFTDVSPLSGSNHYRLRQTDFDGRITHSPVETIEFRNEGRVGLYPNPATSELTIQLPEGARVLGLTDVAGRQTNLQISGEGGQLRTDVSSLPAGVYFLRVQLSSERLVVRRLIIQAKM